MQDIEKILKMDNIHILQSMISGDMNLINWKDEEDNNLLIFAFNLNLSDEIIEYLMKYINFRDSNQLGISPFNEAIRKGRKDWVNFMIKNGVDINFTERDSKFTPLMESVTSNRIDILKILLENGANLHLKDKFGFSATDFARKMNKKELLKILKNSEK